MSPEYTTHLPQGTGFATMPHGLTAEVEFERYELWRVRAIADDWQPTTRIRLSGGPFDGWAWDVVLLPDRFIVDDGDGDYRPTLTTASDGVYLWVSTPRE